MAEGGKEGDGPVGYPGTGRHQAQWFHNLKKSAPSLTRERAGTIFNLRGDSAAGDDDEGLPVLGRTGFGAGFPTPGSRHDFASPSRGAARG